VTKYLRKSSQKEEVLFLLMVAEISVYGYLAPLFLGM
jgi:hypothetical protein